MIRAHRKLDAGEVGPREVATGEDGGELGGGPVGARASGLSVRLPYDERHRRRLAVRTVQGERVLIDLPEALHLSHGDRLALEDGRTLTIEAEPEAVVDIFAEEPAHLARLAWHLGNRHTPAAVLADRLRIRRDHVLEAMLARHGARLEARKAPFDPEPGAYHGEGGAGHSHSHSHGHPRSNPHPHVHAHGAPGERHAGSSNKVEPSGPHRSEAGTVRKS